MKTSPSFVAQQKRWRVFYVRKWTCWFLVIGCSKERNRARARRRNWQARIPSRTHCAFCMLCPPICQRPAMAGLFFQCTVWRRHRRHWAQRFQCSPPASMARKILTFHMGMRACLMASKFGISDLAGLGGCIFLGACGGG